LEKVLRPSCFQKGASLPTLAEQNRRSLRGAFAPLNNNISPLSKRERGIKGMRAINKIHACHIGITKPDKKPIRVIIIHYGYSRRT
jgi:hypothetical protein